MPAPPPSQKLIVPIFKIGAVTYAAHSFYRDGASPEIFVACVSNLGDAGIAVFDPTGKLLRSSKVDWDGTGAGFQAGFGFPILLAPFGQYIVSVCEVGFVLYIFVLDRTTLAYVKHQTYVPICNFPAGHLAISGDEKFVGMAYNSTQPMTFAEFHSYHIPSNTVTHKTWAAFNPPLSGLPDGLCFDKYGFLWFGNGNGTIDKCTVSQVGGATVATKVLSVTPNPGGVGFHAVTYDPQRHNVILWYRNLLLTRVWNLNSETVCSNGRYPFWQVEHFGDWNGSNSERMNWHSNPVFTDIHAAADPQPPSKGIFVVNTLNSKAVFIDRNYWPNGLADWAAAELPSFYDINSYLIWAATAGGAELLSLYFDLWWNIPTKTPVAPLIKLGGKMTKPFPYSFQNRRG